MLWYFFGTMLLKALHIVSVYSDEQQGSQYPTAAWNGVIPNWFVVPYYFSYGGLGHLPYNTIVSCVCI